MEINIDEFSLEDLQKQFLQVQEEESTFRLSELNIVELVNYLIRTKRLKNVMFTLDGREYVTEDQLRREVLDQIELSGGRINRTDLPELMNVDFSHIENICNKLISRDRTMHLVQGEILTDEYLDSVCEEVNETLQESGVLYLGDMTKRLVLPSEFIHQMVSERINAKKIVGRLDNDTLFTQGFIRRQKARVRGALSALTRPTPLTQVNPGIQESLFDTIMKELVKEKRVFGTIHRGVYVPKLYESAMENAVVNFFNQNGFISFDRVEGMMYFKSGANATRNYIKEKLNGAIFVTSGVVSQTLCDTLDGSIDEALANNTPLDIMTVVPSQLEKEDIRKLLAHCPSIDKYRQHLKKEPFVLFNDSYLMTMKNIDDIVMSFEDRAKNDVKKILSVQPKKTEQTKTSAPKDEVDSDEEEATTSRGKGKKGKSGGASRKKGTKKGKVSRDEEEDDSVSLNNKQQDKALLALVPNKKDIISQIQKLLKDDAPSQYDDEADEIYEDIVRYLTPLLQALYSKCRESIFVDASADRRKQHQEFEKRAQDLYYEILLNYKAINSLIAEESERREVDENSLKFKLEKYLIKTKCTYLSFMIAENQALHDQLPIDTSSVQQLLSDPDTDEDKLSTEMVKIIKDVIKRLPKEEDQKMLTALQNSLQGSMEQFLLKLSEATESFNIFLRKLDKKKEKEYLSGKKQELKVMVIPQLIDPAKLLLGLCIYIFLNRSNMLIHAPGKLVQQLITYLSKHVLKDNSDDDGELIDHLNLAQQYVTKYLVALRKTDQSSSFLFDEQEQLDESLSKINQKLGIQATPTPQTSSNNLKSDVTEEQPISTPEEDSEPQSPATKKGKKKARKI